MNAIYEMAEIVQRVEKTNLELAKNARPDGNLRGTLVMSRIISVDASLNAVPSECEVYLDRRTIPVRPQTGDPARDGPARRRQEGDVGSRYALPEKLDGPGYQV